MLSCRPKACDGIPRSGHSLNFDDDDLPDIDLVERAERDGNVEIKAAAPKSAASKKSIISEALSCRCVCKGTDDFEEVVGTSERYGPERTLSFDSAVGYTLLEDDEEEKDAQTFVKELNSMKEHVVGLRAIVTSLIIMVVGLSSALTVVIYGQLDMSEQAKARTFALLASIPIVALLFTWFHIWLAIQMMFRPLSFLGIWQYRDTGLGIGWQGIVPRKAKKMAEDSYKYAQPHLDGPRTWLSRVHAPDLVAQMRPQLHGIIKDSLKKVGSRHFPRAAEWVSESAQEKIATTAVDKIQETSGELWKKFTDLLCDKDIGIDNAGMIVKVFTENKELLNRFFLTLGKHEFRFIEHCGAFMGFLCGLLQLIAFNHLTPTGRAFFLPLTGFVLGIISNWGAITCVFKPCHPIPVRICGFHICDIQGLFLKRQSEVAVLYSKLLTEHFLSFVKVVNYLQEQPKLWQELKEAYVAHNSRVLRETLGASTEWLGTLALGQQEYEAVEEDLKKALVKGLAKSSDIHKIGGKYIGKVTNIEQSNCNALRRMPPNEFEDLLHPVFQEDEWILILLGGILGMIVGFGQVVFLSN